MEAETPEMIWGGYALQQARLAQWLRDKPERKKTMAMMRAKMQVFGLQKNDGNVVLNMAPVTEKPFGPEGESEDNTYARWTPSGSLQLSITNPALLNKFSEGQKFYVDFTEANQ